MTTRVRTRARKPAGRPMKCFVAMPFTGFDDIYYKGISPAVEDCFGAGTCSRGDTAAVAEVVSDRIVEEIIWSDVIVALITGNNPNVMYEVGVAHSLRKPTLLLMDEEHLDHAPFDVRAQRIIGYKSQPAVDYKQLRKKLQEYLQPIRDNPAYKATNVLTRLLGQKYFPYVDDFRGWMLGYRDVLSMESAAKTVWEINPDSHWVAEDRKFIDRIKESIENNSKKYYYLIPKKLNVIRGLENAIREVSSRMDGDKDRRVRSCLKYVAIEPSFFELMPFSVVIYNAMTAPIDAILLEPMAAEIGKDEFDGEAASQMDDGKSKQAHPWTEKTFDVRIGDRDVIDFLITTFQDRWNKGIELECAQASPEDREFLNSTWRIP
jgi:hypothetical protein